MTIPIDDALNIDCWWSSTPIRSYFNGLQLCSCCRTFTSPAPKSEPTQLGDGEFQQPWTQFPRTSFRRQMQEAQPGESTCRSLKTAYQRSKFSGLLQNCNRIKDQMTQDEPKWNSAPTSYSEKPIQASLYAGYQGEQEEFKVQSTGSRHVESK